MRKYWPRSAGGGRLAGRSRPARLLGGVAAAAAVTVAMLPAMALAAPGAGSGASAHAAAAAVRGTGQATAPARSASPTAAAGPVGPGPTGPALARRVCPVPSAPGTAACDSLVRTDAASRPGQLAAGVLPPGYGPADLQSAYKLPSATAGAGATVAVVDAYDDANAESDLAVYRATYGLPPCTTANGCFRKVNQAGGSLPPARNVGWATEISLDLDMVSATCPKCHILLVEANTDLATDLGAAVNEAVALGAKYVSNSYTVANVGAALETQWDAQYYNHPGVVITASGGDSGLENAGQGPSFPADSPHVVAVGGTALTRDPSSPRGWSETVWNDGGLSATGSGCGYLPKPPWQGTNTACNGSPGVNQRSFNDVSAVADPLTGVAVYDSFGDAGWDVLGGTSASSPLIAATYALAGAPTGGSYPAAALYASTGHASLNDITSGNNDISGIGECSSLPAPENVICTAGPGWDGPTGWGTPSGVSDFAAGPHGTVTGTVTSGGAPVAGAQVMIGNATAITDRAGRYSTTVLDGTYTPSASLYGYATQTAGQVTVTSGGSVRQDFTLTRQPLATVSGTVRDASGHGWPLYAEVTVPGTPVVAYTSPVTGGYSLQVPVTGQPYTLHVSAQATGYLAADTQVTPAVGGLRQDIGLNADGTSCPAGYQQQVNGLSETFDSGTTPAGWTVQNIADGGSATMQWAFDNPNHRANSTGGTGGFALVDGPNSPPTSLFEATTMTSPVFDLSSAKAPVLKFGQDLIFGDGASNVSIAFTADGGQTWQTLYQEIGGRNPSIPGPDTEVIPLPAAGKSQVQVRFTFGFGLGQLSQPASLWEVDDVLAGDLSCQPLPGGLVAGIVRDANTGQPVDGATVSGGGQQVTTAPEPGDPAVSGGLYELFAPAGPLGLAVAADGYSDGAAAVSVAADAVTRADVTLAAGRLAVSPGGVAVRAAMGGSATATMKVTNTGSAPVTVAPATQAGPVTVAGQASGQASAAAPAGPGAPLRLVPGRFSPAPGLAAVGGALRQRLRAALSRAATPGQAATSATSAGPWTPQWVTVAHYPEFGIDMTAATDPATGTVYVVGGSIGGDRANAAPEAYAYDPATGAWSQLPSMPEGRNAAVAGVIGGKLYVTGGSLNDGTMDPSLDVYDPHTRLWSQAAPIPHPYYGSGGAVLGGKLYVIGGCGLDPYGNGQCESTDVQVYDPATRSWSQAAPYPAQISFEGCGAISGKLYCAGGFDHALQRGTTAAYAYDPAANTWTALAPMPADLWGGASAAANGQLLMSGGITRDDQVLTNQGYAYDPVTGSWSPLPNAPDAAYRGASACGFYAIGGVDQNGLSSNVAQLPGYTQCDGGAGAGWLAATPAQVTLAPGQSATVTLRVTASATQVPQPGTYAATVSLDSGQPYPAPQVPVTLTAAPPPGWAGLTGVISGKDCTGTVTRLDDATVQVTGTAGAQTLITGTDGRYLRWLPADGSPLTLIITAAGWRAATAQVRLRAGKVTTASITLTPPGCG